LNTPKDIKKIVRKFKFQKDREGVMTRFLIEKTHWASHIKHTKDFILEASFSKGKGICMILGSGWWLDIPVDELCLQYDLLIMVDITHPPQILQKIKKYPKIVTVEADITGILKPLSDNKDFSDASFIDKLSVSKMIRWIENINPDFIVSSNIVTQLSYFPKHYVSQRTNNYSIINTLTQKIEGDHLNLLLTGKSCLITEYFQYVYNQKDELIDEAQRLSVELPLDRIKKEWIWDFDLKGNFISDKKVRFNVAALEL
jgi:hypothetical protein